jgi:hypothetical protein
LRGRLDAQAERLDQFAHDDRRPGGIRLVDKEFLTDGIGAGRIVRIDEINRQVDDGVAFAAGCRSSVCKFANARRACFSIAPPTNAPESRATGITVAYRTPTAAIAAPGAL